MLSLINTARYNIARLHPLYVNDWLETAALKYI
jgi:hypothetical protein